MTAQETEQTEAKKSWGVYLIGSLGFLFTLLLAVVVIYFREEIQSVRQYGYLSAFLINILGGVTIIPVPSLVMTFTFGHVLNPVYVGLVAGLGEALGGVTIYLTGAGMGKILSRLSQKRQNQGYQSSQDPKLTRPASSQLQPKRETFYRRLVSWLGGRGGPWTVFLTSAMVLSPFYFAGLAAGSLRMGLWRFFLISWAGKTVKGLAIAFAGYGGLSLLLRWFNV